MKNIILIITVFFFGCKLMEGQNPSSKCCEEKLKEGVNENWKYDSNQQKYISNSKFLAGFDSLYKNCLYGKDTSYIGKVLGTHYTIRPRGKEFILQFPTNLCSAESCGLFYFTLNEKYQFLRNDFILIDKGNPME